MVGHTLSYFKKGCTYQNEDIYVCVVCVYARVCDVVEICTNCNSIIMFFMQVLEAFKSISGETRFI